MGRCNRRRVLKGYVRLYANGRPNLKTFTQDLTKKGKIDWCYIEIECGLEEE